MSSRVDGGVPRHFITSDDVRSAASRNQSHMTLPQNCTVTDEARELALKFSIRLDDAGAVKRSPAEGPPAQRPNGAAAVAAGRQTSADDTSGRVVEAVTQVLEELKLGERKAALLPIIVRQVIAGLTANRS